MTNIEELLIFGLKFLISFLSIFMLSNAIVYRNTDDEFIENLIGFISFSLILPVIDFVSSIRTFGELLYIIYNRAQPRFEQSFKLLFVMIILSIIVICIYLVFNRYLIKYMIVNLKDD